MRKVGLLGAVLALLGAAGTLRAQTATGQITGTVKDATGAVVPGVSVTVTSELTGAKREATTGQAGNYAVPLLPVSVYSVTATLQGFRPAKSTGIRLNVDQVVRVDLELQTGELTEAIEVQADTVALDTETATVGHLITEKQITDLPLNGRNFLQLLFLGAGAVETSGEQGAFRQGAGNAISLMGARPTSNNFMIDGTANIDTALGTPAVILSVDALGEFKEQTATYSAEYGFSANQVNLVSKSGTNDLHGTLFLFGRNEALDARNFFDPPGRAKPELDQKQFGGVVSGPLVRNKTFLLVNYEGTRVDRGFSRFNIVPTPDELAGRFSQTIIDPMTGQPFPNNTIPQSRFSRLARVALDRGWWPAPNISARQGNYQDIRTLPQTQNQYTIRLDQDLGRFGRAFGRFTRTTFDNTVAHSVSEFGDVVFNQNTSNWQVSHTWPIRNNVVNAFRFGRVEALAEQGAKIPVDQATYDALGFTGIFPFQDMTEAQLAYPRINFSRGGFVQGGGGTNVYTTSNQPMWDISNTTTWVAGNHTLKFGVNYRRWWLQRDLSNTYLGSFVFSGDFTGQPIADMLLGYYSSSGLFQPAAFSIPGHAGNPREFNFMYLAPYLQDDWKLSERLTLNLGLRWDYRNVPYETNDRMAWRNLNYAPGGLLVADRTLVERGIVDGAYYQFADRRSPENPDRFNVFAPRFGFAYRTSASGKTVIRGGYGVFFDSAEGREIDGAADVYPYVSRGSYPQSVGQPTPLRTTDQLYPSFAAQGVATPAANTFLGVSQSPEPRNPHVQQWSLGVQRQLTGTTTVELNYVGNKGTNLLMRRNIAQALPYMPDRPTVAERKPFPNFVTYIDADWGGRSNYNSLNATLTHRARSLLTTVAFTWAKSTDSKSAAAGIGQDLAGWQGFLNNHDPERDHGLSDFDVDYRVVASFVWNLPFGRGERIGGDASGFKQAVIGGWQVNGIYLWQRGFPFQVTANDLGGVLDTSGTNRADIVGDIHAGGGEITRWFNTAAFAQPALGSFGNSGRNILRGPGINNLDLALFKNFDLPRGTTLQFRVESFNALNHPQFAPLSGSARNVNTANFGVITSARPGRINQLALKLIW